MIGCHQHPMKRRPNNSTQINKQHERHNVHTHTHTNTVTTLKTMRPHSNLYGLISRHFSSQRLRWVWGWRQNASSRAERQAWDSLCAPAWTNTPSFFQKATFIRCANRLPSHERHADSNDKQTRDREDDREGGPGL